MTGNATSTDVEFVKALLDFARDDARQVYVRVTAALALSVLYVTQLPFDRLVALDDRWSLVLLVGLGLPVLAAGLWFFYVERVHLARRRIARVLVSAGQRVDVNAVDSEYAKVWDRWKLLFWIADGCFGAGLVALGAVLAHMLH